jgi:broad specificity phosphatase PhoE
LYEQRRHVGKFYFRPPGGESWCDVILRLRSVLDTITREYCRERVLIVGHQVTVNCLRYLLERLDEATILAFDRKGDVPNCSVTSYSFDRSLGKRGKLALRLASFIAPLEAAGTPVTAQKDVPAAPKA